MADPTNMAAWITGPGARPFQVSPAPMPSPGPNEIIVRNRALAFNIVDAYLQLPSFPLNPPTYPFVLGSDMAGEITAIGTSVTRLAKGDRVTVCADGFATGKASNSAFQLYAASDARLVAKLPDNVSFADGVIFPLAMCTAAAGLFEKGCMGLELPEEPAKPKNGQVVLIWGGASGVGSCAIQLAKAAGYEVAATASEKNLGYLKGIGADYVFDYAKEGVEDEIVGALKGKRFAGGYGIIFLAPAAVGQTARVIERLSDLKYVQTSMAPGMPAPEGLPEGFEARPVYGTTIADNEIGKHVFSKWMPAALASGSLQCKPEPLVVGEGLGCVQEAVDRIAAGVSAKKVVVELP